MAKVTLLVLSRLGFGLACISAFWFGLGSRLSIPLWQVAILPAAIAGGALCWRSSSSRVILVLGALMLALMSAIEGHVVRQHVMLTSAADRVEPLVKPDGDDPSTRAKPVFSMVDAAIVWRDSLRERWVEFALTVGVSMVGSLGAGHFAYHSAKSKA